MDLKLELSPLTGIETPALCLLEFEDAKNPYIPAAYQYVRDSGELSGKTFEMTLLHGVPGFASARILVVGSGKKDKFDASEARKLSSAALRFLKGKALTAMAFALPDGFQDDACVSAATEGLILGDFEPDIYKTKKDDGRRMASASVVLAEARDDASEALQRGKIIAEAQNFARDLATEPPNVLNPLALAAHARKMADEFGLECDVLEQDRMSQLGMGALLGVAMGSASPPALIVLKYVPVVDAEPGRPHLGLVGKGVTFDTGGISIKPSDNMEKMKYDMCGGAAAIGAMRALAQLKPTIPVTAFIPTVENMPGSKAQRPGDIVKTMSGKTVEVLNTDAEGRMILADALTYAKTLGCTHLIDAATLTGAIVVALGSLKAGVFSNDASFQDRWMQAAQSAGERMWAMPMDDDYKEALKNSYADLQNIGGRAGGSITAAKFIEEFADGTPWVHLDIAGTAWLDDPKPWMAKGPTGTPVRGFVELAMSWEWSEGCEFRADSPPSRIPGV